MARHPTRPALLLLCVAALAPAGPVLASIAPRHVMCFRHLESLRQEGVEAVRATTAVCGGDEVRGRTSRTGPTSYVVTPAGTILCLHHGTGLDARAPRAVLVAEGVADPALLARANPVGIFGDDGARSQVAIVAAVVVVLLWRLAAGRLGPTGRGLYLLVLPLVVFAGWPGMLAPMNSWYAPLVSRALWWGLMGRLAIALLVVEVVFEGLALALAADEVR